MHITTQKIILVLSILVSIETAIAGGTLSLTNAVAAAWIPFVVAWCGILAFIGSTVVAVLAGNSVVRGPAPAPAAPVAAAPVVGAGPAAKAIVLLAILILGALLVPTPGHAQLRKPAVTGHLANDIQTDLHGGVPVTADGTTAEADPLAALQAKLNAKVAADLRVSLALATQKDASGNMTDPTAAPCYQALLDLNTLVNSFNPTPAPAAAAAPVAGTGTPPAAATPAAPAPDQPGVVAHFEQLRIIRNALQSQKFKDACAPLVQDIQSSANQLIGQVLSVVGGAAKLGIAIP